MVVHKHLLIRSYVEEPFTETQDAKNWLRELVQKIGMKLLPNGGPHSDYVEVEGNEGLTGVAMIETSHIAMHIWDKLDPPLLQMDVYSCADYEVDTIVDHLKVMKPISLEYMSIDRNDNLKLESNGKIEF